MNRRVLSFAVLPLAMPVGLAAQDAPVCSEPGMSASVVVHPGEEIADLTLWRGTTPEEARAPEWREMSCAPVEGSAEGTTPEIPEGWGVPDLEMIESLLFEAEEVVELRSVERTSASSEPYTLQGAPVQADVEASPAQGVRAIFLDPDQPDQPLHVLVEQATPTRLDVRVESRIGSIDLSWARTMDEPAWQRADLPI